MVKAFNLILLLVVIVNGIFLINQRFYVRGLNTTLAILQKKTDKLNQEYGRLLLEEGTYSSSLVIEDYSKVSLGLVKPDKQHIMRLN